MAWPIFTRTRSAIVGFPPPTSTGRIANSFSPEVERATGQLCAVYSTYGIAEQKIISKWLEEISYGFHEVKLFLATQVYDAGRKVEALRKRALHGSGVIGKAPLSDVSESWYSALTFTDMIIALDVVYKSYELTTFECATDWARSDFDRDLFATPGRGQPPAPRVRPQAP